MLQAVQHLLDAVLFYGTVTRRTAHSSINDDGYDTTIVLATSLAYAALIQLLNISADVDMNYYTRRLEIARSASHFIRDAGARRLLHTALPVEYQSALS